MLLSFCQCLTLILTTWNCTFTCLADLPIIQTVFLAQAQHHNVNLIVSSWVSAHVGTAQGLSLGRAAGPIAHQCNHASLISGLIWSMVIVMRWPAVDERMSKRGWGYHSLFHSPQT